MMSTFATTYASAFILVAYFVGAIPFGLVLTKLAGMGDIRAIGSGNIGATNVLRTGNKFLALSTLVLDGGKGAAMGLLVWAVTGEISLGYLAGFAAFFGHLFPIYLGFKGGKGVATGLGLFLGIEPIIGALACVTWLVVAFLFRYSSLSALTAHFGTFIYGRPECDRTRKRRTKLHHGGRRHGLHRLGSPRRERDACATELAKSRWLRDEVDVMTVPSVTDYSSRTRRSCVCLGRKGLGPSPFIGCLNDLAA